MLCSAGCPIVGATFTATLIEGTTGPKSGAVETTCDVVVKWESDGTAVEGSVDKFTNAGGGRIKREREAGKESSQTDNIASNGIKIYLNVDTSNEADNNVDTKNTPDEWFLR